MFAAEATCSPDGSSGVSIEDRLLELSETLCLESSLLDASVTFTARDDSASSVFLRKGGAAVRWPGTPWIGAGLSRSLSVPFVPGLRFPILERTWVDIDSASALHASAGGLLGTTLEFAGYMIPGGDTVTVFSIQSPWLGLGSIGYSGTELFGADSTIDLDVFTVLLDMRFIQPWVVLARTGSGTDSAAVLLEGDGYMPLEMDWGGLELIPSFEWAGDSIDCPGDAFEAGRTAVGIEALLRPRRLAVSGSASCSYDPGDPRGTTGRLSAGMTSENGFLHSLSIEGIGSPSWRGAASSVLHTGRTSMGGGVLVFDDSIRVGGTAGYAPTPGVHALLDVSARVRDGSASRPAGSLSTAFSLRGCRALVMITRASGETTLSASLCAVFP